MKFFISKKSRKLKDTMRRVGYKFDYKDRKTGEPSFSRSLFGGRRFPRFHIYVADHPERWILKIHLDQKPHSYKGKSAHLGEYEGPTLKKEVNRIKEALDRLKRTESSQDMKNKSENKRSLKPKIITVIITLLFIFLALWLFWF